MAKRKTRRRGRNSIWGKLAKIIAAIAIPILFLGGGGYALNEYMKIEKIDADYCYDRPGQPVSLNWLDASLGEISAPQLRDYRSAYAREYDRAKPNTRFYFFTTTADVQATLVKPIFTICKPAATPVEQDALKAPSKPAPYLEKQAGEAKAQFDAAVDQVLAKSQEASQQAGDSPILEQVRELSKFDGFQGPTRQLTIITDGLQNSQIARFCSVQGDMPSFDTFKTRRNYRSIKPRSFEGTDVSVLMVEHYELPQAGLEYCTNAELQLWWEDFFYGNDADTVDLTPLRMWAER